MHTTSLVTWGHGAAVTSFLQGVEALLTFYVPSLFIVGHNVRTLSWEGGVTGQVKGVLAKTVLQQCLAIHVHLLQDWECKAEYTRTLSTALLSWQPYMSALPGCCFVEEACEALLSRMVARRRSNTHVTTLEDLLRLYVTLPVPRSMAPGTRGALRQPLVELILGRLRHAIRHAADQPYARVTSAKEAHWEPSLPDVCGMPPKPDEYAGGTSLAPVLQNALVTIAGGAAASGELRDVADATFPRQTDGQRASRGAAMVRLQGWAAQRRQRAATARGTVAKPRAARAAKAPASADGATSSSPAAPPAPPLPDTQDAQSDVGSLYEPPDGDDEYSAGYHSFGDTDSLGSAGDLVEGRQADWDTPDDLVPWEDIE